MNVWTNAVVTDKGLDLLAKLTQGNTLDITRAVTGAGSVTPGFLSKQTEVTDPKQTLTLRPVIYPETGKCALPVSLTNEGVDVGYYATQVGVFAMDPDEGEILFFIVQSMDADSGTNIPSETEMPGYSAEWTFYFQYGQADGVNVTVDPSNTVSRQEMEEYVSKNAVSRQGMEEYVSKNAVSRQEMEEYVSKNAVSRQGMEEYVSKNAVSRQGMEEYVSKNTVSQQGMEDFIKATFVPITNEQIDAILAK